MQSAPAVPQPPPPHAVLLDMDGTLTRPLIDFDAIRRDLGIGPVPILEAVEAMSPDDRRRAMEIVDRHEAEAAGASCLADGCRELLDYLHAAQIPHGVVTRNSRQSAALTFTRHGLRPVVTVAREEGVYKPDPRPLRLALQRLGMKAHGTGVWMVGDGVHDVEAGVAAGAFTLWLRLGRTRRFHPTPDLEVDGLPDVVSLLERASLPVGNNRAVGTYKGV